MILYCSQWTGLFLVILLCYMNAHGLNNTVDDSLGGGFCLEMTGRGAAVNMFTSALVASLHR